MARPLGLAEEAVRQKPKEANALGTLGLALYRAERHPKAVRRLEEAIRGQGEDVSLPDWLALEMAYHKAGRAAVARKWLVKAAATMHKCEYLNTPTWEQRLEAQYLRREAEEALKK